MKPNYQISTSENPGSALWHLHVKKVTNIVMWTSFTATNSVEKIIGGASVYQNQNFIVIEALWISLECRAQGVGKDLFFQIVNFGIQQKCDYLLGSTLSSDNCLEFWTKLGCKVVGEAKDCPKNETTIYLQKKIQN